MKLLLIPLLAIILSCSVGDATELVYDTEGHELMSNSIYYILPVVEGGNGSGLIMSYEWRPCNYFVAQAQGKAKDGMAVRIQPSNASRLNPVAVPLSTDVMCNEHGTIYAISSDFGDRMTMQSMGLIVLLSEHFYIPGMK